MTSARKKLFDFLLKMYLHHWVLWCSTIAAEGRIASPPCRERGANTDASCGPRTKGDGSVQAFIASAIYSPSCNPWLCNGYQLESEELVQQYAPGQIVPVKYDITRQRIGTANMSVVSTQNNKILFDQLIYFNHFGRLEKAATGVEFIVTLPQFQGTDCQRAGECVLQFVCTSHRKLQSLTFAVLGCHRGESHFRILRRFRGKQRSR